MRLRLMMLKSVSLSVRTSRSASCMYGAYRATLHAMAKSSGHWMPWWTTVVSSWALKVPAKAWPGRRCCGRAATSKLLGIPASRKPKPDLEASWSMMNSAPECQRSLPLHLVRNLDHTSKSSCMCGVMGTREKGEVR